MHDRKELGLRRRPAARDLVKEHRLGVPQVASSSGRSSTSAASTIGSRKSSPKRLSERMSPPGRPEGESFERQREESSTGRSGSGRALRREAMTRTPRFTPRLAALFNVAASGAK
jgi:hypothetical protein